MSAEYQKQFLVFAGNPGVGKSRFLNLLIGDEKFASGFSPVGGKTKKAQIHKGDDGVTYVDIPGLDDVEIKNAADEISKGFRLDGDYRICFIFTTERGRLRPADLQTVTSVMESIKTKFSWILIINQIHPNDFKEVQQNVHLYNAAFTKSPPAKTLLFKMDPDWDEVYKQMKDALKRLPATYINPNKVQRIDVVDFRAKCEELEERLKLAEERANQVRSSDAYERKIDGIPIRCHGCGFVRAVSAAEVFAWTVSGFQLQIPCSKCRGILTLL
jgi:hypothetical protein